ncbi:MAG TPA: rRNA maturation RNase YbeY [Gemmatimonadaceae bacterium]
MTVVVDVSVESGRLPIARATVAAAVEAVLRAEHERNAMFSVTFVTTRAMQRINVRTFGRRAPTDVISLGSRTPSNGFLVGDIYVAPDVARENARREGLGVRDELLRLVVHGVLHAIGYDHPEGDERTSSPMWRRQERLVGRLRRSLVRT